MILRGGKKAGSYDTVGGHFWTSIADAMLGFSAVIIIMLLVLLIREYQNREKKVQIESLRASEYFRVGSYRFSLYNRFKRAKMEELARKIRKHIKDYKEETGRENIRIAIKGHTDIKPVKRGAAYADNWELSARRARFILYYFLNHTKALSKRNYFGKKVYKKYFIIEGFADTELKNTSNPHSYQNRRIQIAMYWNYKKPEEE